MSDMVFRFPAPGAAPLETDLEGWVKAEGTPSMKTWVQHTSRDGGTISGTWEATPGAWQVTTRYYEFVHLIEGQMTLTPDGGTPVVVKAGEALVVEAGFTGLWRIDSPVRKHFCLRLT